jgi:hypothetical protein
LDSVVVAADVIVACGDAASAVVVVVEVEVDATLMFDVVTCRAT